MKIFRPLIYLNKLNRNGRMYTTTDVELAIKDFKQKKQLTGVMYGELNHPETFDISLKNVSHTIDDVYIKDHVLWGKLMVLKTQAGNTVNQNLDNFVFRPRAVGVVRADNTVDIQKLLTFDAIPKETDSFIDYYAKVEPKWSVWQTVKEWFWKKFQ